MRTADGPGWEREKKGIIAPPPRAALALLYSPEAKKRYPVEGKRGRDVKFSPLEAGILVRNTALEGGEICDALHQNSARIRPGHGK